MQGEQGPTGLQGEQGHTGLQGEQGPTGIQGAQGTQGDIGPTGTQGTQGVQGEQGHTGLQGEQGPTGLQGEQGPTGADGADASTSLLKLGVSQQIIEFGEFGGTIIAANSYILVSIGTSGSFVSNITVDNISSPDGTVIVLQGSNPLLTITVHNTVHIRLVNGQSFGLTGYNTLQLIYNNNVWIELNRKVVSFNPSNPPQQAVLTISESPQTSIISPSLAAITISAPGTYELEYFVSSNNSSISLLYSYNPTTPNGIIFNTSTNNGITTTTMTIESVNTQFFDIIVSQAGNNSYYAPNPVQLNVYITT